jgi:ribonucleoside-diphosphate reductase alpha chain
MYDKDKNDVDWHKLSTTIRYAIRFLDNVVTMNNYPIPECKTSAEQSRRIGLGVMGLHYLLIKLGLKYGKQKSLEFVERFFATFRNEAFEASIDLSLEKGSFPMYDYEQFSSGNFVKNLPTRLLRKMKKNGIRNGMITTIPPTGTVSQLANVSSGIEPIFAPIYKRAYRKDDNIVEEVLVDSLFYEYYINNQSLTNFISAYDISPEEHIAVQASIQQFIDNSISKTVNLPESYTNYEEISDIIFEYSKHLKGITLYRQNSRGKEPLTEIKYKDKNELKGLISKASNIVAPESKCSTGQCEL